MTDPVRSEPRLAAVAAPSEPPAIVAEDVHVRYRLYDQRTRSPRDLLTRRPGRVRREVHAVRGVDLQIRQGEAVGIIGRNGSGKSTLLRALTGLVPPTGGVVRASSVPVLLGVSALMQGELSCRRNIVLGATALGMRRQEAKNRVPEVLAFAGLEDYADLPFRALSSGMRARLQFSVATSIDPQILMIDEALAVGDAEFRARSEKRMSEIIRGSGTVVLVSHSIGQVVSMCSRIVWIDAGEIRLDGPAAEVAAAYTSAMRPST